MLGNLLRNRCKAAQEQAEEEDRVVFVEVTDEEAAANPNLPTRILAMLPKRLRMPAGPGALWLER